MGNISLKLPFTYSLELLQQDLLICKNHSFINHYNTAGYQGTWQSISLRSQTGKSNHIIALGDDPNQFFNTPLLDACIYFKTIINQFLCDKTSIRLLKLFPGSFIKEHTDHHLGYSDGIFRIHIPIQTNDQVLFKIDGKRIVMQEGECWYGNFNLPHSVVNAGNEDRIHLVMDCIRNNWSDRLFENCGYDFNIENKLKPISTETKIRMIEELELHQSETAKKLIRQLKQELYPKNRT